MGMESNSCKLELLPPITPTFSVHKADKQPCFHHVCGANGRSTSSALMRVIPAAHSLEFFGCVHFFTPPAGVFLGDDVSARGERSLVRSRSTAIAPRRLLINRGALFLVFLSAKFPEWERRPPPPLPVAPENEVHRYVIVPRKSGVVRWMALLRWSTWSCSLVGIERLEEQAEGLGEMIRRPTASARGLRILFRCCPFRA